MLFLVSASEIYQSGSLKGEGKTAGRRLNAKAVALVYGKL